MVFNNVVNSRKKIWNFNIKRYTVCVKWVKTNQVYWTIDSLFSRQKQTRGEKEKSIEEKSLLMLQSFLRSRVFDWFDCTYGWSVIVITFYSSSCFDSSCTCSPVYHTRRRLHSVPLILLNVKQGSCEYQFYRLWVDLPGIEPETNVLVIDAVYPFNHCLVFNFSL